MKAAILVNGQPAAQIAVADRGLHYGDGVFETLAVLHGEPLCLERHLHRLEHGCRQLGFGAPLPEIRRESLQLAAACERSVLKIIVTRGAGGRGYQAPATCTPNRVLSTHDWPDHPGYFHDEGIAVPLCSLRLSPQPALAGIKHLNRLEQVLARTEVVSKGFAEGVMLDCDEYVIEGTMSNLFAVRGAELITPELDRCGVAGIIREMILEHAPGLGLSATVRRMTLEELYAADEAFLCNSIIGIWPLRRIAERALRIGPHTQAIAGALVHVRCIAPP